MQNKGFIKGLLLIIIGLALLKYFFNWSIFDAVESKEGRETISYIRNILNTLWSYLETPLAYIWREVVLPLINEIINKVA